MNKKAKIIFTLILVLVLISLTYTKFIKKDDKGHNIGKVVLKEKAPPDIEQVIMKFNDFKDYYKYKAYNYPIMLFFKGINDKKSYIEPFPEYKEFFNLSDDYFIEEFKDMDNVFYKIISFEENNNLAFIEITYKEEGDKDFYTDIFSSDGTYIVNEPFIRIEDINSDFSTSRYSINLIGRAVYKDKCVYKIKVVNNTDGVIEIDSSMYGFYARGNYNKYYHRLVKGVYSYKIHPLGEVTYYVEIPSVDIDELYINIDGDEIAIL